MAERKIQLVRIAHVYYKHKNIEAARAFYDDFGFFETERIGNRTFYRGYGTEPFVLCAEEGDKDEFLGPGFVVESLEDLEYAAKTLPGATGIYELENVPGGGKCVTFKDPVDGWPFHLVYGQESVPQEPPEFPELKINYVSRLTLEGFYLSEEPRADGGYSPWSRTAASTRSSASRSGPRPCTSSATLACA